MDKPYTISSRRYRTGSLIAANATYREVQTIQLDGRYFCDVPDGEDANALLEELNEQARKANDYRARFSDSEWDRQMDEAAGG